MKHFGKWGRFSNPAASALGLTAGVLLLALLGAGCPPDRTPPGSVANFIALAGDAQVLLQWANPPDGDLAGVKIQRKTGDYPTGPADGVTVFEGPGATHTDTTASNGVQYFYMAYAYDASGNYAPGQQATATPTSAQADEEVLEQSAELKDDLDGVPDEVLAEEQKAALGDALTEADLLYRAGDPCAASETLREDYMALVQEYREEALETAKINPQPEPPGSTLGVLTELYNRGRMLRWEILLTVAEKSDCPGAERVGIESDAVPEEQNSGILTASGIFGEPIVRTSEEQYGENGKAIREVFTQVIIPGMDSLHGVPGVPGVPIFRRLIAAPRGSEPMIILQKENIEIAESILMNLYPAQESPVDQNDIDPAFANKPFFKNPDAYNTDAPYPPEPVRLTYVGDARDVQIFLLEIASGQYRPLSQRFDLYKGFNVDVQFQGGSGAFLTENTTGPFESATGVVASGVLNNLAVSKYIERGVTPRLTGEELLILTHPDFRTAADTLAAWKQEKGIITSVFDCGTGSGITGRSTNTEIDTFIHNRYSTVAIRPSYILLFGDAEHIAPFYIGTGGNAGSDWPYAILGPIGVDMVPDFAVGRISVDNLTEANRVVQKIINYEKTPPVNANFYSRAAIAAQFQCCRTDVANHGTDQRTFIEVSEFARNVMVNAGKMVDRIYMETVSGSYTGTTTPRRYYDGTLLPAAIGAGSGFAWNGTTANISAAINQGRFLVMHRDHGGIDGWEHPGFSTTNVNALTNGDLLPVIFSVNCSSGRWDTETSWNSNMVSFSEAALRKNAGGAVGVICDTRDSPSWANSVLTQGFFDAIWPNAIPGFGDATAKRRLGDILNHGKMYMMSKVGVTVMGETIFNSDAVFNVYIWHCLGDPTLEIWTRNPNLTILPATIKYRLLISGINLEYAQDGAEITVLQYPPDLNEPVAVARGVVQGGVATLPFIMPPHPLGDLLFSASMPNAVSRQIAGKSLE